MASTASRGASRSSSGSTVSLKGRALRWLSQREHSRLELRAKLLRAAARAAPSAAEFAAVEGEEAPATPVAGEIDRLLDWLAEHGYLSDARFAESRIRARASRLGGERILHELKQHGITPDAEAARTLRESELERATALWRRKFGRARSAEGEPASVVDAAEKARQMRFLMGRGFSAEIARRVLRNQGEAPE